MADDNPKHLSNTARRTRRALLEAASRLMRAGRQLSLEEVAEEALVSRATAYRYFTGIEPLLVEAALHVAMPSAAMFDDDRSEDPLDRLLRAEAAVHDMIVANEPALRAMLVHSLQVRLAAGGAADAPARQNRRTPLIEAALSPARGRIPPERLDKLTKALALVVGTEARLVFRDVLQLDDTEARAVKAWAIEALVEAAATPA